MKYKLIKKYPGSPPIETVVEQEQLSKSYFFRSGDRNTCVLNDHVEGNPEYWEKVNENLWWIVFTNEEASFKAYTPYSIETCVYQAEDSRHYFKTRNEAEEFILNNKPCLSYKQIKGHLSSGQRDVIINLIKKL